MLTWQLRCVRLSRARAAAVSHWKCLESNPGRRGARRHPSSTLDTSDDAGPDDQSSASRRGRATSVDGAAAAPAGDGSVQAALAAVAAADDVREADVSAEAFACQLAEIKEIQESDLTIVCIPRRARIQVADALCELMEDILTN